ncbi:MULTISPECIES: hypothetical protein [Paenibacillus]|uniref:hypothetical protein n=1 Tax=Paenibacillus TaxID=44249 RepID=UPI001FCA05D0|nr:MULTISPECIES: hypothetical protein [Paenibacillus]
MNEVSPLYSLMIADIGNKNIMEVAQKEQLTALADQISEDNEQFLVDDPTVSLSSATFDEKNTELRPLSWMPPTIISWAISPPKASARR